MYEVVVKRGLRSRQEASRLGPKCDSLALNGQEQKIDKECGSHATVRSLNPRDVHNSRLDALNAAEDIAR